MPTITLSRQAFLDSFVKPAATFLGLAQPPSVSPYDVFAAAVLAIQPPSGSTFDPDAIPITIPDWMLPPAPGLQPPVPTVTAVDPEQVLESIAKALKRAEGVLNDANLAVLQGSVTLKLEVAVDGVAGATTEFTLQIGPSPTD